MTGLHYSTFFVLRATIYKLNIGMNIPGKEGKDEKYIVAFNRIACGDWHKMTD